jgi:hypothetical protein
MRIPVATGVAPTTPVRVEAGPRCHPGCDRDLRRSYEGQSETARVTRRCNPTHANAARLMTRGGSVGAASDRCNHPCRGGGIDRQRGRRPVTVTVASCPEHACAASGCRRPGGRPAAHPCGEPSWFREHPCVAFLACRHAPHCPWPCVALTVDVPLWPRRRWSENPSSDHPDSPCRGGTKSFGIGWATACRPPPLSSVTRGVRHGFLPTGADAGGTSN